MRATFGPDWWKNKPKKQGHPKTINRVNTIPFLRAENIALREANIALREANIALRGRNVVVSLDLTLSSEEEDIDDLEPTPPTPTQSTQLTPTQDSHRWVSVAVVCSICCWVALRIYIRDFFASQMMDP